jgi:beta-lactamase class C
MLMLSLRSAVLSFCLVAFSPAALNPASAQAIDYDRLDQRLTRLAAEDEIVGLAVAVIENGEIRFARGYGVTTHGGTPVSDTTVFRWASLSKGVAASEVTKLAEQGKLSLADPVAKFGTSLRLPGGAERMATLEDVLSHQLSIVSNAFDTRLEDGRDPAEIRRSLGNLKAICPVGECHTYQNVAFDTLSEVIESVTHTSYADAVRKALFEPLGMVSASIGRVGLQASESWAEPHVKRGRTAGLPERKVVNDDYYRVPAAGGVNGSIRDLALYARAQMGLEPDVLSEFALAQMQTPRVYTRREQSGITRRYKGHMKDARYALGWRVYKYGETGTRVVGHRGAVEGYRSLILFDPEKDTGVVALWNSSSRLPVGVEFEVMDMAYNLPPQDWMELDTDRAGGGK